MSNAGRLDPHPVWVLSSTPEVGELTGVLGGTAAGDGLARTGGVSSAQ